MAAANDQHDLSSEAKAFDNYVHDFQAAEKTAHGEEFETTTFLEDVASKVEERVAALKYTLGIYDMLSGSERVKVRDLVREQLKLTSWLLRSDVERVAGMLSFVKSPATAQTGVKMRDDIRSLVERLDAIASSLK